MSFHLKWSGGGLRGQSRLHSNQQVASKTLELGVGLEEQRRPRLHKDFRPRAQDEEREEKLTCVCSLNVLLLALYVNFTLQSDQRTQCQRLWCSTSREICQYKAYCMRACLCVCGCVCVSEQVQLWVILSTNTFLKKINDGFWRFKNDVNKWQLC